MNITDARKGLARPVARQVIAQDRYHLFRWLRERPALSRSLAWKHCGLCRHKTHRSLSYRLTTTSVERNPQQIQSNQPRNGLKVVARFQLIRVTACKLLKDWCPHNKEPAHYRALVLLCLKRYCQLNSAINKITEPTT